LLICLYTRKCKWAKSRVKADAKRDDGAARFTVTVDDDGPGLSKDVDESKPGSGLGLSIVADLAHLYKGRFELEPSPKGGSRAKLELPAA